MSLKLRLTLAVIALLAAVTAVLGYAVVTVNRSAGIQRVDDRLEDFVGGAPIRGLVSAGQRPDRGQPAAEGVGEVTTVSYGWDAATAQWVSFVPNVETLIDSPPVLPAPGTPEFQLMLTEAVTVQSVDGAQEYRVRTVQTRFASGAVATSLEEVERTSRALVRIVLIAGLLAVLVGAVLCWLVIRQALRPVDRMVTTAQAIARGDLSQRVEHPDDGSELARLGAALDEMLTQLEADAAERERANARLRQFVADASHELRTPVAAVRGYSELFRTGGIPQGEATDLAMQRIETESIRMGRLIEDLLLLTRLDQDVAVTLSTIDLSRVVEESVGAFRVIQPGRTLSASIAAGIEVRGDAVRLRQVVDNLVGNAFAHTADGDDVRILLSADGSSASLIVSDDGPGIPAEQREAIFERFARLDDSRTRATGGAGLGLSIVKAIVNAHDGVVEVRSSASGGAEFVVQLPLATAPSTDVGTDAQPTTAEV